MFCQHCGKETNSINQRCEHCGEILNGQIIEEPVLSSPPLNPEQDLTEFIQNPANLDALPKKSKKKFFIIGTIALVVLVLSVGAFAAYNVIFNTPKNQYMLIELKNLTSTIDSTSDSYEKYYNKEIKPILENNYQDKYEVSLNTDLKVIPDVDPFMAQSISDIVSKIKFSSDNKTNPKTKQSLNDFSISLEGTSLLKGTLLQDDAKKGLIVPDLYQKYIMVDTTDMKPVYKNLNIQNAENLPGKIKSLSPSEVFSAIHINKDDINMDDIHKLVENYGKIYFDSVDDKNITLEKNVTFDADGEQIKCNKFTVKLDEKWFKDFVLKVYDTSSEDDLLFSVVYDNMANVLKLMKDAGYFPEDQIKIDDYLDKNKFKEKMKSGRDDFKNNLDKIKIPNGITMTLWTNSQKQILGRSLVSTIGDDKDLVDMAMNTKSFDRKNDGARINGIELQLLPKSSTTNEKVILKATMQSTKDDNQNENVKLKVEATAFVNNQNSNLILNLNSNKSLDSASNSHKRNIQFDITAGDGKEEFKSSGELDINVSSNDKTKTTNTEYITKLNIAIPTIEQPLSLKFNVKRERTLGIDFKLPEITSTNSISLNTASQDELNSVIQEAFVSVQKLFQENSKLFESLIPSAF